MKVGSDASGDRTRQQAVPWWRSIRLPIALAASLVTLAVLVGTGLVVDWQSGVDGRERLRQQALERLDATATVFEIDGRLTSGASLDPSLPPPALAASVERVDSRSTLYDGERMWASTRLGPEVLLTVRLPAADLQDQQRDLRWSMIRAGAVGLLVAGVFGWLAATGISRRLRRGARTASLVGGSVTADGAGVRASVGGRDEVTALTEAVDRMAADLARRLQRERQFGADVAHELRTPLTALVSAAELLPHDEPGDLLRRQVDRLRVLVDDLLELFRAESAAEVDAVDADLATAVDTALAAQSAPPAVEVGSSSDVAVDPRRFERVLGNLVANARTHGAEPVTVRVEGDTVVVRDHGPGLPNVLVSEGPRRFQRHSGRPGSGLGLAIAQAQAAAMGAELHLANHPDGGAEVSLRCRAAGTSGDRPTPPADRRSG